VKLEVEIEELLRDAVAGIELDRLADDQDEFNRFLQRQLRAQGQAILRLAAAVDGLADE
jgi:hypothetical protein